MRVHRRRTTRGRVALVVLTVSIGLVAAACLPPPPPPPTVIVYGDSLTQESATAITDRIQQLRPGYRVLVRAAVGAAICNMFGRMDDDRNEGARLVVIQFSGNNLTQCVAGLGTDSPELVWKYLVDADYVANLWAGRGVPVLFVGNPRREGMTGPSPFDVAYQAVANSHAGSATFDPTPGYITSLDVQVEDPPIPSGVFHTEKTWPLTMECLPDETAALGCVPGALPTDPSTIQVRTKAGDIHFCLVEGAWPCPVYSSGVRRFGDAIAQAAAALL